MSQENVEFLRAVYASWGRGIDDELWDRVAPDFVADSSRSSVIAEEGVAHGREQVRARMNRYLEAWKGYRNDPEELVDAGDKVLAVVRVSGAGRASGIPVETRVAHVWTFRDGLCIRVEFFGDDRAAALAAAGLEKSDDRT
jgi:ketosteroid isomerase-like protein